jgi:hypothetical protein
MSKFLTAVITLLVSQLAFGQASSSVSAGAPSAAVMYFKGLAIANETLRALAPKEASENFENKEPETGPYGKGLERVGILKSTDKNALHNEANHDWLSVVVRRQSADRLAAMIRTEAPRLADFLIEEMLLRIAQDLGDIPQYADEEVPVGEALKIAAKQDMIFDGIDGSLRSLVSIIQKAQHSDDDLAFIRGVAIATGVLRRASVHVSPSADPEHLFDENDKAHRLSKMKSDASAFMAKELAANIELVKLPVLKSFLAQSASQLGKAASTGTTFDERSAALESVFVSINEKIQEKIQNVR